MLKYRSSCKQHWFRPGRPLDRTLPRMHPVRLGRLGRWSRSLLNTGRVVKHSQANWVWYSHRRRCRQHTAALTHRRSSRRRKTRHGRRHCFPEVCPSSLSLLFHSHPSNTEQLRPESRRDTRPRDRRDNNVRPDPPFPSKGKSNN